MPENPPRGMPRITPYLLYEDATAAVDWLTRAFGFEEKVRFEDEGAVTHAELWLEGGVVYLGRPGGHYRCAKSLGQATQQVHVYVDDVDAHCERTKAPEPPSSPNRKTSPTATAATTPRISKASAGHSPSTSGTCRPTSGERPSRRAETPVSR